MQYIFFSSLVEPYGTNYTQPEKGDLLYVSDLAHYPIIRAQLTLLPSLCKNCWQYNDFSASVVKEFGIGF